MSEEISGQTQDPAMLDQAQSAVQPIPENADPMQETPEPKKPSKLELKRQQIFQDRMKRHIAAGKTPEQAYIAIQREDYERLPLDKKLGMLQASFGQQIEQMARNVASLHDNERTLADIMDINFRAFGKLLKKLGISDEELQKTIDDTNAEMAAERAAYKAQMARDIEEAKKKSLAESVDQAGEVKVPEGATVFGG